MRGVIALLLLAGASLAQTGVPRIAQQGLTQWPDGRAKLVSPGMILTFYGENLAPETGCSRQIPQNGPYPSDACGVRVVVDGSPAGLLYVGAKQVNFKIPDDAPADGSAPIQVCVRESCSDPVVFRFSARKAFIKLQGHAYVHMPVWIQVEQPWGDVRYPYSIFPLNFGGNQIEVFYKGEPLAPARTAIEMGGGGTAAPKDSPW